MEPVIIPAILAKTRAELLHKISIVRDHVPEIQLDIMDGEFVPNTTVGLEALKGLPNSKLEYHWMVKDPENWISHCPGNHMHLIHIETIRSFDDIEQQVRSSGGRLGLAINPETPLDTLLPYVPRTKRVLIMTVRPGFSGQKYLAEMEKKVARLRSLYPDLDIEVDGGVNENTIGGAYAAGANILAAASAIFSSDDAKRAITRLKECALSGCNK